MSVLLLIRDLQESGVMLTVRGDKLHVEAKRGTVTPELRQRLIDAKAKLLPLIRIRDRLLTIARELGLPDALVLELPESELIATAEQYHDFAAEKGEELGRRLLVFYLRSLAGIEPALPGSLAERDAPGRRARWQG